MSNEGISVSIGADTKELNSGMDGAAKATAKASADMQAALLAVSKASAEAAKLMQASMTGAGSATDDLSDGLQQAKKEAVTLRSVMKEAGEASKAAFKAIGQGIGEGIGGAVEDTKLKTIALGAAIGAAFSVVGLGVFYAVLKTIYETMGFLIGLITGSAYKSENIDKLIKANDEAKRTADILLISAQRASALGDALARLGVPKDAYTDAFTKAEAAMRGNEEELNRIGVATRDQNGKMLDTQKILENARDALGEYREGWDRQRAEMALGMGSFAQMNQVLSVTDAQIEKSRERLNDYNLGIGGETGEAVERYQAAMREFGNETKLMGDGISRVFADAIMPALTDFAEFFKDGFPVIVRAFRGMVGAITAIFYGLKTSLGIVLEIIIATIQSIASAMLGVSDAVTKVFKGDLKGAWQSLKDGGIGAVDAFSAAFSRATDRARKDVGAIKMAFGVDDRFMPGERKKQGSKTYEAANKKEDGKASATPSILRELEAQLKERQLMEQEAAQAQGRYYEMRLSDLRAYWQKALSIEGLSSNDQVSIRIKIADISKQMMMEDYHARLEDYKRQEAAAGADYRSKIEIEEAKLALIKQLHGEQHKETKEQQRKIEQLHRDHTAQLKQIDDIRRTTARDARLNAIDQERADLQLQMDMGLINKREMLEAEARFEQAKHQIRLAALNEQLASTDPKDKVAIEQKNAEILALEQQFQNRMSEIKRQAAQQDNEQITSILKSTEQAFTNAFAGILNGTMSVGKALKSIFQGVFQAITQELAKFVAQWIMKQIAMKIFGKTLGVGEVAKNAAIAASAAYASTAAIPIMGPILAPGAAAGAYAGAMAYALTIPAAKGGYDIPASVNPLTQLHEREMVLPAKHADVIRNLADNGGSVGGGGSVTNIHISAMDARSFERYLQSNNTALMRAIGNGQRNFVPVN